MVVCVTVKGAWRKTLEVVKKTGKRLYLHATPGAPFFNLVALVKARVPWHRYATLAFLFCHFMGVSLVKVPCLLYFRVDSNESMRDSLISAQESESTAPLEM